MAILNATQGLDLYFMDAKATHVGRLAQNGLAHSGLAEITAHFADLRAELGTVRFYEMLAVKLCGAIGRKKVWTWRYVQGVEKGSIQASREFERAVVAVGMALDGAPVETRGTVAVGVFAEPGAVLEGSLILGKTQICAWPGCGVKFVPRVPWQKYCRRSHK